MVLFPRVHSHTLTTLSNQTYHHALFMAYVRFTASKLRLWPSKVLTMSNRLGTFIYEYFGHVGSCQLQELSLGKPGSSQTPTR